MLRRRGSAPAVVLQQHITEPKGVLCKADRIIPSPDASRLSKTSRRKKDQLERSCSPPPLALGDRRTNIEMNHGVEYCESPPPKSSSPASPGSPNLNVKPTRHRTKRRESEPFVSQAPNGSINARSSSSSLQRRSSSFRDYNIVLLGQGGVGKSALLVRFTTGRFIHEYDPTLELTYDMCYEVDEEPAVLHITDTASANEPVYLSQNEGFIVVYAIDEPRTFQTAKQLIKLIRELKKQRGQHTAIVLVGNKVDLNHSRSVSNKEALEFASEYECYFHETSAANNINVKVVFQDAVRQLRLYQLNRRTNGPMNSLKNFFSR
ncbi:GTP-binding protein Rit1 [Acropora cervicornis]|uniref:small monomeric GTPase n=1 Tax=Acropora cervicornis TaxID=6130 RepID=A0AAD9R5M7_ACRCE|nr:GTP-binding protein Rit1 [Acropora cervicornis]